MITDPRPGNTVVQFSDHTKERLLRLADVIERADRLDIRYFAVYGDEHEVDFTQLFDDCNTAGCVAGFGAAISLADGHDFAGTALSPDVICNRWLGLSSNDPEVCVDTYMWRRLYAPHGSLWEDLPEQRRFPTAADAAAVLRRIASGEIVL